MYCLESKLFEVCIQLLLVYMLYAFFTAPEPLMFGIPVAEGDLIKHIHIDPNKGCSYTHWQGLWGAEVGVQPAWELFAI